MIDVYVDYAAGICESSATKEYKHGKRTPPDMSEMSLNDAGLRAVIRSVYLSL